MSESAASSASGESRVSTTPDTRLRGRWLILARVGWIVVVILTHSRSSSAASHHTR